MLFCWIDGIDHAAASSAVFRGRDSGRPWRCCSQGQKGFKEEATDWHQEAD